MSRLGQAERRLLLRCGRPAMDAAVAAETADLLRRPMDWAALALFARLHSVGPLLYKQLRALGAVAAVPAAARTALLRQRHRAEYQNRIYDRENGRIIDALSDAGVPVLIQKGLSLLELAYDGLADRPLIDLIFFVPATHVERTRQVMLGLGYRQRATPARERVFRWCCPQHHFVAAREARIAVLVQWHLVNWPKVQRFDPEPLWARARPARVSGRDVLVLSPVDLLLYLCLQADNHGFYNRVAVDVMDPTELLFAAWTNNRLIRFTDILAVIRRFAAELDWELLVERARECGIAESAYASLRLTDRLLGPLVDPGVLDALRTARRNRLRRWIFGALSADRDRGARRRLRNRLLAGLGPRKQLRLGRLVGLAEYAVPDPAAFHMLYGARGAALRLITHVRHAAGVVLRSFAAWTGLWTRGWMHPHAAGPAPEIQTIDGTTRR